MSIKSDRNLHADADHLLNELRTIAYKRLIGELIFEIGTVVWELTSTVLNWVVVGQVLSGGTTNLSDLSVGYIIVVIISTFAVGANTVSRITNFQFMKHHVEEEVVKGSKQNSEKVAGIGAAIAGGDLDSSSIEVKNHQSPTSMVSELDLRTVIKDIHRKILRLKIHLLSIVLHALPFIVLNLVTLYERADIGSSKSITILISLLVSFLLVGMKVQELKDYPNQRKLLLQAEYELVQFKISALETHVRTMESGTGQMGLDRYDHLNCHQLNPLHQLQLDSQHGLQVNDMNQAGAVTRDQTIELELTTPPYVTTDPHPSG